MTTMRMLLTTTLALAGTASAGTYTVKAADAKSKVAVAAVKTHADKLAAPAEDMVLTVTINKLETKPKVSCKLSLSISSAKGSMFAFLQGGASVDGSDDQSKADCIDAVAGDLVDKKVAQAIADQAAKPKDAKDKPKAPEKTK